MKYLVCKKQGDEGGDYTIGCGMRYDYIDANSIEDAIELTVSWFVVNSLRTKTAWRILQFALWLNNTSRPGLPHVGIPCVHCGAIPTPDVSWACPRR